MPEQIAGLPVGGWISLLLAASITLLVLAVVAAVVSAVVLRIKNVRKARRWADKESRWEPLLQQVLVGERPPEDLQRRVRPGEELYFVDLLYRYARRLRGAEREVLSVLAYPHLDGIARRARRGDAERRARAIRTLSLLGLPKYGKEVEAALDDPSPLVAMIAARALARREHPEYAAAVLDRMHRFQNWRSGFLAAMMAGIGPRAAPALREALADRAKRPEVRAVAADALARLNDVQSGDVALQVLYTANDQDLLAAALRLLRAVGRAEHLAGIRPLLKSPHFAVRAQAVGAMGRLGSGGEAGTLMKVFEADASPWVAMHAARGLRDIDGGRTLRELVVAGHPRADVARQILGER